MPNEVSLAERTYTKDISKAWPWKSERSQAPAFVRMTGNYNRK